MSKRFSNNNFIERWKTPRARGYMNITLTILAISIFGAFAIRPSISVAIQLRKNIREYKRIDNQLTQKILDMRKIRTLHKSISEDIHLIDKAVPEDPQESKLLKDINYIALKNNISLRNINYTYDNQATNSTDTMDTDTTESTESTNSTGIYKDSLHITTTVTGTYEGLTNFLLDIKNMLRIVNIKSMSISINKENVLTVSIDAVAFYEK